MKILAVDTALGAVSACIYASEGRQTPAAASIAMARGHAETLLPLVDGSAVVKRFGPSPLPASAALALKAPCPG